MKEIKKIQEEMRKLNIDAYYILTADNHLSEYIMDYYKSIKFLTGFSGSLAHLLITQDEALLWVDGRYHVQAENETKKYGIKVMKDGVKGVLDLKTYLKTNFKNKKIAFDGQLASSKFVLWLKEFSKICSIDLVSEVFKNRKPLSKKAIRSLDDKICGLDRKTKLKQLKDVYKENVLIIGNLEEIAYGLNCRGSDILYTPVFDSFFVYEDGNNYLFIDYDKVSEELNLQLREDEIILKPIKQFYSFLKKIKNRKIFIDFDKTNYEILKSVENKNKLFDQKSLWHEMKAIKNEAEIKGMEKAHIYDAVSMIRLFMWLDKQKLNEINEYDVSNKLKDIRLNNHAFDLSFNTICAYQENGAMMHYGPSVENAKYLDNKGLLLIDSGGHYPFGTTDITRTISLGKPSAKEKKYFTIVLKSMFNLANLVFMKGLSGSQIDVEARKYLWKEGIDYRCGTGHGVGHILSVHEAPPNIRYGKLASGAESVSLKPGMIVSDEPGVYFENEFGIRSENLLCVVKKMETEYGQFYGFKHLTYVPFDLKLIDKKYLNDDEIDTINKYHQDCVKILTPYLNKEELSYLKKITRGIK